jgi:hypothetical protein
MKRYWNHCEHREELRISQSDFTTSSPMGWYFLRVDGIMQLQWSNISFDWLYSNLPKKYTHEARALHTRQILENSLPFSRVCGEKIKKRWTRSFIVNFHFTFQFVDRDKILEGNLTDNCRISEIETSHSFCRYSQISFSGTRMSQNPLISQSMAIIREQISNHPFIFQHNLWCWQLQESTSLWFYITKNLQSVCLSFCSVK